MSWSGPESVEVLDADGTIDTLDLRDAVNRAMRLDAVREVAMPGVRQPRIKVRRRRSDNWAGGHAKVRLGEIVLSIGQECEREQVEHLILHEVVHHVLPQEVHHDGRYRAALIRACREWWPCDRVREVRNEGPMWALDKALWTAAREHASTCPWCRKRKIDPEAGIGLEPACFVCWENYLDAKYD